MLVGCIALGVLDAFVLLISIGFGPSGFGGDATRTASQVATAHRAEYGGAVALAFSVASIPVFWTLRRRPEPLLVALLACLVTEVAGFLILVTLG